MSTEVVDRTEAQSLLGDEQVWTGRIFSDGWTDAPETIAVTEPANLELWTEWQWMTSRDKAEPFPF